MQTNGTDEFDALVYIGRFQLPHAGHGSVFDAARPRAKKLYNLIGSASTPRSRKNPFLYHERFRMNVGAFADPVDPTWLQVYPLIDRESNDDWAAHVRLTVAAINFLNNIRGDARIGLIGHIKDESSFYLRMFPEWEMIDIGNYEGLSSTPIRNDYFENAEAALEKHSAYLHPTVIDFLRKFATTDEYLRLRDE